MVTVKVLAFAPAASAVLAGVTVMRPNPMIERPVETAIVRVPAASLDIPVALDTVIERPSPLIAETVDAPLFVRLAPFVAAKPVAFNA